MKKYNLALIPQQTSKQFVSIASELAPRQTASYCLGANSLPHVTIRHFRAEEKDIEKYWQQFIEMLCAHQLTLIFSRFSCLSFDNKVYYTSLLPDQCEPLFKLHKVASQILRLDEKSGYDPHLTLFNTKNAHYLDKVSAYKSIYVPIQDVFKLSIGLSDGIGQYLRILKSS